MKVCVIGTGYVGLVAGTCFAEMGNDVICVDNDKEKLKKLEQSILDLGDNPFKGVEPRYLVLKRQGYKVLILEKNIVFYKVDEQKKEVIVYAVVDQRQDYLNIIRGL